MRARSPRGDVPIRRWSGYWPRRISGSCDLPLARAAASSPSRKVNQISSSYVTRVIYLAFLAPDVALAIARGEQPVTLTAKQLLLSVPLPPDWVEQRHRLGFA